MCNTLLPQNVLRNTAFGVMLCTMMSRRNDYAWPTNSVRLPPEATACLDAFKTRMPAASRNLVILWALLHLPPATETERAAQLALRNRIARQGLGLPAVLRPDSEPPRLL